jgi:hypothetical protein
MEDRSKKAKLGLAALAVGAALSSFGLSQTANAAATHHHRWQQGNAPTWSDRQLAASQEGPFPEHRTADGTLTGPIDRSSNGG